MAQVAFEIYAFDGARWVLQQTFGASQREQALDWGQQLYAQSHVRGVRVIQETFDAASGESKQKSLLTRTKSDAVPKDLNREIVGAKAMEPPGRAPRKSAPVASRPVPGLPAGRPASPARRAAPAGPLQWVPCPAAPPPPPKAPVVPTVEIEDDLEATKAARAPGELPADAARLLALFHDALVALPRDGAYMKDGRLDAFAWFGCHLFFAGLCDAEAKRAAWPAEIAQRVVATAVTASTADPKIAARFASRYDDYLTDPRHLAMFERGAATARHAAGSVVASPLPQPLQARSPNAHPPPP